MARAAVEALRHETSGRRFFLNFLYCYQLPVFPPTVDVRQVLRDCFDTLDPSRSSVEIANHIRNAIVKHALAWPNANHRAFGIDNYIYRIIDHQTLAVRRDSLLSKRFLSARGINYMDVFPITMNRLAHFVSTPAAINKSHTLRGRMPFAWVSPDVSSDTCFHSVSMAPAEKGKFFSQTLALYYDTAPLFMLRLGSDVISRGTFRRPHAFDGYGGTFFKARNTVDRPGAPAAHGATLSINELLRLAPVATATFCDGSPELIAYALRPGNDMACVWLDTFDPDWVAVNDLEVDRVLSGRDDVDRAVDEAINLVESLL